MVLSLRHGQLIFFFLALAVMLSGYGIITETNDFIHSAAVAKTGSYTKSTNTSTSNATQNQTSTSTTPSSTVASNQQNQSGYYVKQPSPSYGYSIYQPNQSNISNASSSTKNESPQNQSTTSEEPPAENVTSPPPHEEVQEDNGTVSEAPPNASNQTANFSAPPTLEHPAPIPKPAPKIEEKMKLVVNITPAVARMPQIILTVSNPTSAPIQIQPKVEEIITPFANEARIMEILSAELQTEAAVNIPEKLKKNLEILTILEKENIKPVYVRKVYHPFQSLSGAVTYTGKRTSGQQLTLPVLASTTVLPREKKQVVVEIPQPLSAVGRKVQFKVLADGEAVYTTTLSITPSLTTAIDVDKIKHALDVYIAIPKDEGAGESEYLLEMQIDNSRKGYYEVFGPYQVKGEESAFFSQQFRYDPAKLQGKKIVTLTLFKGGSRIQQQQQEID